MKDSIHVTNSEYNIDSEYIDNDIDEDMKLTRDDYIKLLHHYQQKDHPKKDKPSPIFEKLSFKDLENKAHNILSRKFCKCINGDKRTNNKDTTNTNERPRQYLSKKRIISYCTRSIFNNRGLKRHGFKCRNRTHKLTQPVTKTQKNLIL